MDNISALEGLGAVDPPIREPVSGRNGHRAGPDAVHQSLDAAIHPCH